MSTPRSNYSPSYGLSLDFETTGFSYPNFAEKHQGIALGAVVVRLADLTPIETLRCYIQHDPRYEWDPQAERVHGLTQAFLAEHGVSGEEAAVQLANLIVKYWGSLSEQVVLMGQNISFDRAFLRQLMEPHGIMFELSHLFLETHCLGFVNLGLWKSEQIYQAMGLEARAQHDPLQDALYTVEVCQRMRTIFTHALENL